MKPYACFNQPRPVADSVTHLAQSGWSGTFYDGFRMPHRTPIYTEIKHVFTTACQYDQGTTDQRCAGCEHIKQNGEMTK